MTESTVVPGAPGRNASPVGQAPSTGRKSRRRAKWIKTKYGRMMVPYEAWTKVVE